MHQQLPKSDLKNCRLVNRKTRDIASKVLWHHIRINLIETNNRKLNSILHTKHYGLLANVKILELKRWHDSGCALEGQFSREKYKCLQRTVTANLQLLLNALPKDALTCFHSDLGLNGGNLTTLLATQTRLCSLTVRRARWEYDQLPAVTQVVGNATMLRSLRIDLHCEKEYKKYCKLFSHMVALEELYIRGAGADTHRKPILLTVTPNEAPLLRLRHLDLFNLRINASAASGISTQIYLPRLQKISIRQCWDGSLLLRTFAEAFSISRDQALEAVKYVSVETYTPSLSLMGLLDSVPRLIELESGNLFGMFPYTSSLMRHGDSLRLLCLHALGFSGTLGGSRLYHTLRQLEEIVKSCPNVEALGVTLVDTYWDFALLQNERVRLDSSKLDPSKQQSFTKSLVSHPIRYVPPYYRIHTYVGGHRAVAKASHSTYRERRFATMHPSTKSTRQ